jgi:hypothetical protein
MLHIKSFRRPVVVEARRAAAIARSWALVGGHSTKKLAVARSMRRSIGAAVLDFARPSRTTHSNTILMVVSIMVASPRSLSKTAGNDYERDHALDYQ